MQNEIFITGATGNIGVEIVNHLLRDSNARLTLLIRAKDSGSALSRIHESLSIIDPCFESIEFRQRIRALPGDITLPNLGLPAGDYTNLVKKATHIIHCAASTKFNAPLESARAVNLKGTCLVLKLAEKASLYGNLRKVAFMSTAFVCGDSSGDIPESSHSCKPHFSNSYEQTKWEAEQLIEHRFGQMNIDILRPSIVAGNSLSGRIKEVNVLYIPLKLILQGLVKSLPAHPDNSLDVVPVDYVAKASIHILLNGRKESGSRIYHICAGDKKSPAIDDIIRLTLHHLKPQVSSEILAGMKYMPDYEALKTDFDEFRNPHRVEQVIKAYEPYFLYQRNFDISNLTKELRGSGILLPDFLEYFKRTLDYAMQTRWGNHIVQAA
jgi:thioester reductase-like protein